MSRYMYFDCFVLIIINSVGVFLFEIKRSFLFKFILRYKVLVKIIFICCIIRVFRF